MRSWAQLKGGIPFFETLRDFIIPVSSRRDLLMSIVVMKLLYPSLNVSRRPVVWNSENHSLYF